MILTENEMKCSSYVLIYTHAIWVSLMCFEKFLTHLGNLLLLSSCYCIEFHNEQPGKDSTSCSVILQHELDFARTYFWKSQWRLDHGLSSEMFYPTCCLY